MQGLSRESGNVYVFSRESRRATASNNTTMTRQCADETSHERALFVLGQIGATICHEPGPKPGTSVLTRLAARPADGFWSAIADMNALGTGSLLERKRRDITRLVRTLAHPMPQRASSHEQGAFWAGYCNYWDALLQTHIRQDTQDLAS
ncbi:hypothetical protein BHUM_04234 [Candidatus Burkholderia humilis]|nr:hypothetical protein BHUM_04234 [Candidatus Burkholderia humilis]